MCVSTQPSEFFSHPHISLSQHAAASAIKPTSCGEIISRPYRLCRRPLLCLRSVAVQPRVKGQAASISESLAEAPEK